MEPLKLSYPHRESHTYPKVCSLRFSTTTSNIPYWCHCQKISNIYIIYKITVLRVHELELSKSHFPTGVEH